MRTFLLKTLTFGLCGLFLISGCGYTNKTQLPSDMRRIHVPTFKNAMSVSTTFTYEAGLESKVTNAIINRLIFDGNLKVVDSVEEADMLLLGEIKRYEQEPIGFNSDEGIREFRLFIVTKFTMKNLHTNEIMWTEDDFCASSQYFTADIANQQSATNRAIQTLATYVVNRIVEDW
ncbi:MAG: LPS assembly lipoprotein LptE [Candidatus Omnitrophica bacterium]|nr:LPS assembly lipoprotein LptE [Candidatus Omnitrophota bacterium]